MEIRLALPEEQEDVEALGMKDRHTKDFKHLWRRFGNWEGTGVPIVAWHDRVVAFHAVTFGSRNHYANSYYLYIHENFRRLGIGGKLVEYMLYRAQLLSCERLKMKTQFGSPGKEFWEGFGLRPFAKDDVQHIWDVDIRGVSTIKQLMEPDRDQMPIPFMEMQKYFQKGAVLL